MRKVTFGGANSLDNLFARPDGGADWIMWSDEANEQMAEYWSNIDTVLTGRKTFEVAMKAGGGPEMPGISSYVFSRTLPPGPLHGATVVNTDPVAFVRELKAKPGKDICVMGGGELGCVLLDGGVIDEIGFSIHPVLLGAGVPVFHPLSRQIDLELVECRAFKNGCVYVLYRVKN